MTFGMEHFSVVQETQHGFHRFLTLGCDRMDKAAHTLALC